MPAMIATSPAASSTGILESPPGAEAIIDGRRYLYFAGTAYFALQGHPEVIAAGCRAFERYGVHTATSRGGYGASPPLLEVEQKAAKYFGTDEAYYFLSGYWGNRIVVQALDGRFERIFYDEYSHYSILEAVESAHQPAHAFAHRSSENLAHQVAQYLKPGERPLVISDGVFASTGRIAPADAYINVLQNIPGALLLFDDAHAVGVLGAGRGTLEHFGIPFQQANIHPDEPTAAPLHMFSCGTLSKALGGSGGVIAGSRTWIAHVKQSSHYFNAASGPAAPVAGATARALELVMTDPTIRERQQQNARHLRGGLRAIGLDVEDSPVPFTGVVFRDQATMQYLQSQLRERGIIVAYVAAYSGVPDSGQLRIAVSSAHTPAMIDQLLHELSQLINSLPDLNPLAADD